MANPIVQQINEELAILQKELVKFKSSVHYLTSAKSDVETAVETLNVSEEFFNEKIKELKTSYDSVMNLTENVSNLILKIDKVNFPERLDSIESSIKETFAKLDSIKEATLDELKRASEVIIKADFDGKFENLQEEVNQAVKSIDDFTDKIQNLKIGLKIENVKTSISKEIEKKSTESKQDLRNHISKVSRQISDLNTSSRFDGVDKKLNNITNDLHNLKNKLLELENEQKEKVQDLKDDLLQYNNDVKTISKQQKTNFYIILAVLIVGFILSLIF